MTQLIHLSNPENLDLVNDLIHDCDFDKEDIVIDPHTSTLKIKFAREATEKRTLSKSFLFIKTERFPVEENTLIISNVKNFQIEAGKVEGLGTDECFNIATFDKDKNTIWISLIFDKGIRIKVSEFEIAIEETHKVLDEKTRFTVF